MTPKKVLVGILQWVAVLLLALSWTAMLLVMVAGFSEERTACVNEIISTGKWCTARAAIR